MSNLLDHPLIEQRYFFPREGFFADPFWVDVDGARLACSYHEINPGAKTLVHFHGNGEIVDDWQGDFVSLINQMGCNCLLAELRGYGQSSGRAQLGKMVADVAPTIRALKCREQDLIFFGRSVGSIFALEAAARFPNAAGLVLESAVADVLERLLLRVHPDELNVDLSTFRNAVDQQLNHQQKIASFKGAVLVLHTIHDGLVDVSHGQRLYDWARGRKTIKLFDHGDHNTIMMVNAPEYFASLNQFIRELD
ncbi:alpha/beta hydrolase [uncultured Desulfobacter sp.]|uniref:alpha/beta hydrolase n=1 Tax=uncultured Desulfobacter sp. TaxID=240139 RepID=UPI002AAB9565|nr:alpha/beta hydrolase [uncultured Desulfobacter sp.]